jgi:hypothetical protein
MPETGRCWCTHRADVHGKDRGGHDVCWTCLLATVKLLEHRHIFRPIETLSPIPRGALR